MLYATGHAKTMFSAVDDVAAGEPQDFVIASGKQYSVREFIEWSAKALGIS